LQSAVNGTPVLPAAARALHNRPCSQQQRFFLRQFVKGAHTAEAGVAIRGIVCCFVFVYWFLVNWIGNLEVERLKEFFQLL
jgi:hypothetical protein